MTTAEVVDSVSRERRRLLDAVRSLDDRATTAAVTDDWTAKDVLAHCIHWVGQIAFGLGAKLAPASYIVDAKDRPAGEEWNRRAVAHYSDLSLSDVIAELDRVTDALLERLRSRPDADMVRTDVVPWDRERPLWKMVASETFEHWPGHTSDIERAARSA